MFVQEKEIDERRQRPGRKEEEHREAEGSDKGKQKLSWKHMLVDLSLLVNSVLGHLWEVKKVGIVLVARGV